jgi:hypothetical protein
MSLNEAYAGSDDVEDEEYEEFGGDMTMYDSPLDQVDELLKMKEALQILYQTNQDLYARLMSSVDLEQKK